MRNPEVRGSAERQAIVIRQEVPAGRREHPETPSIKEYTAIEITAAMVPKLCADLMAAAVMLGLDKDFPSQPIRFNA